MEDFQALFKQGVVAERAGNEAAALEAYQDALAIAEIPLAEAAPVLNQMAWLYQSHGDLEAALPLARMAARLDEFSGAFQHTLAAILLARGAIDEALERARQAADLNPTPAVHWVMLARAAEAAGRLEEAVAAMTKAANRDPQFREALEVLKEGLP